MYRKETKSGCKARFVGRPALGFDVAPFVCASEEVSESREATRRPLTLATTSAIPGDEAPRVGVGVKAGLEGLHSQLEAEVEGERFANLR